MKIFHTINSGLIFNDGQSAVIIDGFHGGKGQGNSDSPDLLFQQAFATSLPEELSICFTHRHIDHYKHQSMKVFLSSCPNARVLYEEILYCDSFPSRNKIIPCKVNSDFVMHAFSSAHQGPQSMQVPHYCYLISAGKKKCFVCGDAVIDRKLVASVASVSGGSVDAAFVNVYHLGTEAERELLQALNPQKIFIYHLPLPEDDRFNYRKIAHKEFRELRQHYNIKITEPMHRLSINTR